MSSRPSPLALLTVFVGAFMVFLDVMVVNVAMPHMQATLDADVRDLQSVINWYALAFAFGCLSHLEERENAGSLCASPSRSPGPHHLAVLARPGLSGLRPPSPAPPGSGCPQLLSGRYDALTVAVSHLHSNDSASRRTKAALNAFEITIDGRLSNPGA